MLAGAQNKWGQSPDAQTLLRAVGLDAEKLSVVPGKEPGRAALAARDVLPL